MLRGLALGLALLAWPGSLGAEGLLEGPPPSLRFDLQPPEARLMVYAEEGLRRAATTRDGSFILERPRSNLGSAEVLRCEFQCPGYLPQPLELAWTEVLQYSRSPGGCYPRALRLRPQSPKAYLRTYPWLGLLGLLPLGLPWLALRWRASQRQLRHMARLQQLVPDQARQLDPLLGLAVGRYRLISRLGSGGMASVYRALPEQSLDPDEAVAIKLVRLDAEDAESRQLFEREIALTAKLDHPHIVRTLDWGWEGSRPYLVMEWLEGGSLSQQLQPGGLPLERALALLRPWFAAVQYAHSRGVVHRDLKPDNVMLTRSGVLKLMDFGVARANEATATQGLTGTPGYSAPDGCDDQYSLGVCAFELLSGRRPFEHEEVFGLIRLQLETDPPPLSRFRPGLGSEVDAVLARMLARHKRDRFSDVESAGQALLALLCQPGSPG